ncbi:programmed cell death protein 4-like [Tubulanus polymorphus]|uniref:programmed cell death protein 4-like n=1 Tax=Tubulanus polymorphus TaxID=672921 RepID=UPI003DA4AE31
MMSNNEQFDSNSTTVVVDGQIVLGDEEIPAAMEEEEEIDGGTDLSNKPLRIMRKAKRPSRMTRSLSTGDDPAINGEVADVLGNLHGIKPQPFSKNSRKSRNGRGRGLPKKGGAGGKGVWGRPGSEIGVDGNTNDVNDPNYDSDSQEEVTLKEVEPELSEEDLKKVVEPIIQEYFDHGDTQEVLETLYELGIGRLRVKIPCMAISVAMDKKAHHREMISRLLSDMYGCYLGMDEMTLSFNQLLADLPELTLDIPDAPMMVGQFLARAIADDCLPPKYVQNYSGKPDCEHGKAALHKAFVLLNMKHGIVRLDNVWGVGGGERPVKSLIKKMVLLLKEYLSSGDIAEATRCLQELDVPHFHHELVYEAIVMVIEDSSDRAAEMMTKLLKSLCDAVIITPNQMRQGTWRVYNAMPEICLDVPAAYPLLDKIVTVLYENGIVDDKTYKDLPSRGRKRFMSEGDGGRVKENSLS